MIDAFVYFVGQCTLWIGGLAGLIYAAKWYDDNKVGKVIKEPGFIEFLKQANYADLVGNLHPYLSGNPDSETVFNCVSRNRNLITAWRLRQVNDQP
jgi:hypothetical protein